MKIVIVLGAFFPVPTVMGGAVEKIWLALAREFARRGHDVVLISRCFRDFPEEEKVDGVQHVRVRGFDAPSSLFLLKFFDLIYSWKVRRVLPSWNVLVTNTFWLPLLQSGTYVHVARYPKRQMRFYSRAARLQAPSRAVAQAIVNQAPSLAASVITIPYPAPETSSAGLPPPLTQRENIFLFVGRVHPEKGVHLLVRAFAQVRTVCAEWRLMIVGPSDSRHGGGGEDYLESLKECAGTGVVFAGPVFDAAELEARFRASKVFVYPSVAEHGESFGLAPLEAMTHGCAVVVSSLDCFRDFITDEATGFIFNHRVSDPAGSLANRLKQVVADPATLVRVASTGQTRSEDYRIDRVAEQFLADFKSVSRDG